MIEVRRGQDDAGLPHLRRFLEIGPAGGPTATIAPSVTSGIKPPSVWQTANRRAMGPAAPLAHAGGALEPHAATDLRPVAGIKPPHLRFDRHRQATSAAQYCLSTLRGPPFRRVRFSGWR